MLMGEFGLPVIFIMRITHVLQILTELIWPISKGYWPLISGFFMRCRFSFGKCYLLSCLSKLHCEHCALTHVNLQSGSDEHNQKAQFSKNPSFLFHLNEWFLDFRSFCNKVRTFVVTRPFFVLRLVKIISYRLKLVSLMTVCVVCCLCGCSALFNWIRQKNQSAVKNVDMFFSKWGGGRSNSKSCEWEAV